MNLIWNLLALGQEVAWIVVERKKNEVQHEVQIHFNENSFINFGELIRRIVVLEFIILKHARKHKTVLFQWAQR